MPGFWDDPEVKATAQGSEYVTFGAVGDRAGGTITKLGKRVFNAGTADERLAIEIRFDDAPTVTAGQMLLQRALLELRPEPGDDLWIELASVQKMGAKTLKKFKVSLTRKGETEPTVIDQSKEQGDPEF